jgi:predicted P-loop ATPase
MWGTGAVSRPLRPGNKLDHTLVLIGEQGTGKSTAVEALAMRVEWFNDTPADLRSKDARMALRGTWLMELAELDSLKRSEMAAMKAFLTDSVDRYRPPYARSDTSYPRSTVFVGTSNEHDVLRDPTGNRRFWPVEAGAIDITALTRDREQLWAEAVVRFDRGEQWWPTRKFERMLNLHRERFQVGESWLAPLSEWLADEDTPAEFTTHEALTDGIGLAARDTLSRTAEMRVSALLRQLGYSRGPRRRKGDKRVRTWVKAEGG